MQAKLVLERKSELVNPALLTTLSRPRKKLQPQLNRVRHGDPYLVELEADLLGLNGEMSGDV